MFSLFIDTTPAPSHGEVRLFICVQPRNGLCVVAPLCSLVNASQGNIYAHLLQEQKIEKERRIFWLQTLKRKSSRLNWSSWVWCLKVSRSVGFKSQNLT
jgi:hypothetical protein